MKLMLEKMRDYKSKDPSLFSQIWEQVKKAQPPTSTRDALPASKEVSVPSPHANGGAARLPSPSTPNVTQAVLRQPDPNSQLIQELPTPVIEEDRGKFPAARRRGKKTRPSLEQPTSQVRNVSPPPGPPAGYVHAGDAPSAPVSTGAPGPPNGYIHAGDVDNNTNSFQKCGCQEKEEHVAVGQKAQHLRKRKRTAAINWMVLHRWTMLVPVHLNLCL